MLPRLVSARLRLRPLEPTDAPALLAHLADDREAVERTAAIPWPLTEADMRAWIARVGRDAPLGMVFAVTRRSDGVLLGVAGLSWPAEGPPGGHAGVVEVGYWIGRAHWGRGHATEALGLLLDQGRLLGAREAAAVTFAGNAASERVLEKNGFHRTGAAERCYPARGGVRRVTLWALVL
ncbi:MAG: GNAT family N-acetyltransferase [Desulfovibrionaceae bacterium]